MISKKEQMLLRIFPQPLRNCIEAQIKNCSGIEEFRLRIGQPVIVKIKGKEYYIGKGTELHEQVQAFSYRISPKEMKELLEYISNYSMYAYEDELRQGYLTIQGGHRIGLTGKAVIIGKEVRSLRNITFINIRVAHEHIGIGEKLLPYLFDAEQLCSVLVASAPCCGKTSLLRDVIRCISDGIGCSFPGKTVGIVDERSELAACFQGIPQNNIGHKTDVLDGCPKAAGIQMLLRSMSPQVIAVDELGSEADFEAVKMALHCGCSIFATVHAQDYESIFHKERIRELLQHSFTRLILLGQEKENKFIPRVYEMPSGKRLY